MATFHCLWLKISAKKVFKNFPPHSIRQDSSWQERVYPFPTSLEFYQLQKLIKTPPPRAGDEQVKFAAHVWLHNNSDRKLPKLTFCSACKIPVLESRHRGMHPHTLITTCSNSKQPFRRGPSSSLMPRTVFTPFYVRKFCAFYDGAALGHGTLHIYNTRPLSADYGGRKIRVREPKKTLPSCIRDEILGRLRHRRVLLLLSRYTIIAVIIL
jgi:hypothetical protein